MLDVKTACATRRQPRRRPDPNQPCSPGHPFEVESHPLPAQLRKKGSGCHFLSRLSLCEELLWLALQTADDSGIHLSCGCYGTLLH